MKTFQLFFYKEETLTALVEIEEEDVEEVAVVVMVIEEEVTEEGTILEDIILEVFIHRLFTFIWLSKHNISLLSYFFIKF